MKKVLLDLVYGLLFIGLGVGIVAGITFSLYYFPTIAAIVTFTLLILGFAWALGNTLRGL